MSAKHSTTVYADSYLRKSTSRQEDSIPSQREQVRAFAAREGIVLANEHVDEGIAGDEVIHRPGLQALLAAVRGGKVKAIVVDEFSRLSRADPFTTIAEIIRPLMQAGVALYTVKDGVVSWNSLAGMLMLTIKSVQTSEEVKSLSYRILRSAKLASADGRRCGGRAPYGYRLSDKGGKKMGKAPGKLLTHPPEAEVVRQIFAWCLAGRSPTSIAETLNRLGHCSPFGVKWSKASVRDILTNPVYAGHLCWGRRPGGKHNRFIGGDIIPAAAGQPKVNDVTGWHVTRDAHERLVTQDEFDRAQVELARRRHGKAVARGGYTLSGMLICAACGRTLCGRRDPRYGGEPRYECHPLTDGGERVCQSYGIVETLVLKTIARSLRLAFTDPQRLAKLRTEVEAEAAEAAQLKALAGKRKAVEKANKDVATAKRRLATEDDDRLAVELRQTLKELVSTRDALQADLDAAERSTAVEDLDDAVNAALRVLELLEQAITDADVQLVRDLLRPLISRVEVRWRTVNLPSGKRRHIPEGGEIVLSSVHSGGKVEPPTFPM